MKHYICTGGCGGSSATPGVCEEKICSRFNEPLEACECADMRHNSSETREEFRVSGEELMAKVKALIAEGNARKIIIKNENGETVLEIPLTVGVVGTVIAPVLASLGALAALLTKCTLIVVKKDKNI